MRAWVEGGRGQAWASVVSGGAVPGVVRLGGGEGDSRAGRTGRSGGEGSMAAVTGSGASWASGRAVGSVGRGFRSATCSVKCVQRVVTPVV